MFAEDTAGAAAPAPASTPEKKPSAPKAKKAAAPKAKKPAAKKAKPAPKAKPAAKVAPPKGMTSAAYQPKKGHKVSWSTGSRWGKSEHTGVVAAFVPAGEKADIGSGISKSMTDAGLDPAGTSNRDRVVVKRGEDYVFANVKAITAHS